MAQTPSSLHQIAASVAAQLPQVSLSEPFGEGCLVLDILTPLKEGDSYS
ncbi:hypothetical protein HYG89_14160 [Acinetobacter sp. SwsAc5]|nr:hypothetical protein [Acinetobacter sp. SwsAc5]NWK53668.1 hypothetical protein [Acinetobacter sp. SwsAc5]